MIKYDPEKNPYSNKIEHGWVENDKYLAWRAGYEQALKDVKRYLSEHDSDNAHSSGFCPYEAAKRFLDNA